MCDVDAGPQARTLTMRKLLRPQETRRYSQL